MSLGTQMAAASAKVTGAVGGAPMLVAIAASGLILGGILGGFAGGQPQTPGTSAQILDIYPCWKGGEAFAHAQPGQKVWVTGKNADGTWFRLHSGSPTHPEGWVYASQIKIKDASTLAVVDCGTITALMIVGSPLESQTVVQNNSPSPDPTPTPSPAPTREPRTPRPTETAENTPEPTQAGRATQKPPSQATPKPTKKPTPKPTPTDPPDNTPPKVSNISAAPAVITSNGSCPHAVTVTATITDDSGVDSATVRYRNAQTGASATAGMGGSGNSWSAQIQASTISTMGLGTYTVEVKATDKKGNESAYARGATFALDICPPA
jgi:outer membrane biosynthesis protein TonB